MGRSPHQPDPSLQRQVEAMAAYGIPEFDIARVLKVDPKTLRKYYQEELELGHTKANAQVAGFLFNSAKNGNVTAQIFWLKTRAQWKEPASQHQHVAAVATFDISTIPDEDLEHLKASFDSFSPRDHEILAALSASPEIEQTPSVPSPRRPGRNYRI